MTTQIDINLNFQEPGQVQLMTVAMGLGTSKVLIEMDEKSDPEAGHIVFNIDSADPLDTPEEVIEFLSLALDTFKAAWARRPEGTDEALKLPTVDDVAGTRVDGPDA